VAAKAARGEAALPLFSAALHLLEKNYERKIFDCRDFWRGHFCRRANDNSRRQSG
jgi:hypothetical protein